MEEAEEIQYKDAAYKSEIGHWMGGGGMGPAGLEALFAQMSIIFLDTGSERIEKQKTLLASTPVLGFVITKENNPKSQVMAGRGFERMRLFAASKGLCMEPMSQIVQVPKTKINAEQLLLNESGSLQQVFRLGYCIKKGNKLLHRPPEEFLIN
jgi:hypothetical protein